MRHKYLNNIIMVLALFLLASCDKDDNASTTLQNDCLKRTIGPNLVSREIAFAYAMALPPSDGKIVSVRVEASVAGAAGTWLENNSYHTNSSGDDTGITIGDPSVTDGARTEVTFTRDTCAATLRYYYVIPEEARGQTVSFTFTANASNGETVSYEMGPYTIARMDIKLDMPVKNEANCYISIADMAVYDEATAATLPDNIDLVYLYRNIPNITFAHAFVSPAADAQYLPGVTLPPGVANSAKIKKEWNLRDRHLARLQYGVYVDDIDFVEMDLSNMPDYAIGMKAEAGLWVETKDGKYKAYIYINSVNANGSAVISMKRYAMR